MNYSILSRFQWIRWDANILEMMQRKTDEKKIVLVHVDKAQNPATPVQLVRTEEASRMSGETSSRD